MYDALLLVRKRLQSQLSDLIAECGDVAWAIAEERADQALGVPSMILGPLHARLHACQCAVDAAQAELEQLDALCDGLRALLLAVEAAPLA